jgi:hypothetical protein
MCSSNSATWTSLLSFVAGAVTAIFAEPFRRWLFRPVIRVSFDPETCDLRTPTSVVAAEPTGQYARASQGRWVRVRVQTTRNRIAKGCRPYLVKVEIEEQGQFRPSNFVDTLRLKWSSQPPNETVGPVDIPKGVSQFVDVLSTDRSSPNRYFDQTAQGVPQYCRALFDERPKTLRLTILVTADEAKSATTSFVFRWKGVWDTFEASPA